MSIATSKQNQPLLKQIFKRKSVAKQNFNQKPIPTQNVQSGQQLGKPADRARGFRRERQLHLRLCSGGTKCLKSIKI